MKWKQIKKKVFFVFGLVEWNGWMKANGAAPFIKDWKSFNYGMVGYRFLSQHPIIQTNPIQPYSFPQQEDKLINWLIDAAASLLFN